MLDSTNEHKPESDNAFPIPEGNPVQNIFSGKQDQDRTPAAFPDWDIVPPGQFINPRIKKQ